MLTYVLNEIMNRKQHESRLIVGIDGMSGSGKTTLAEKVKRELTTRGIDVAVVHIDDHIVDRSTRYNTGEEQWREHYFIQWDVPLLTTMLFEKAKQGTELLLDFYDLENDTLSSGTVRLPENGILLIEGVYLQRPEWRDFLDYLVYLDCPRDTRFERVTQREQLGPVDQQRLEKYRKRYWAAEDYYLETVKPLQMADLVWEIK
ncbi:MAG: kinase [Tumebacillaceae bacterium]